MHKPEVDPRIAHIRSDAANFDVAYPVFQKAAARVPYLDDTARAVELFEAIDEAITLGTSSEYLSKLLALADGWNDMCLIAEVSPTAYGRGMAPEYVHAVYLLDYAHDDWKTLSERLAIMHDAGVPADYAAQTASRKLHVSDIAAAWEAGIAAEYVGTLFVRSMTSATMERLRAEFPLVGQTYSLYYIVKDCIVPEEYMRIVLPSVTHPGDMPLLALIVPEMYAAGIPAEFLRDSWRELFRHDDYRSERIIQLYRAGVPVQYAAQLIEYDEDASLAIAAWSAGLAPEYAREALS